MDMTLEAIIEHVHATLWHVFDVTLGPPCRWLLDRLLKFLD